MQYLGAIFVLKLKKWVFFCIKVEFLSPSTLFHTILLFVDMHAPLRGSHARFARENTTKHSQGRETALFGYFREGTMRILPDHPFRIIHPITVDKLIEITAIYGLEELRYIGSVNQ